MAADSTLDDVRPSRDGPLPRWGRRAGLSVLLIVVVAGACGLLGVRSRTVDAQGGSYQLSVTYPQVARAGLDVPFRVSVHRGGGLTAPLVLAISSDWFRMFETQGFFPSPDAMTTDARFVYFTFQHPHGTDFVMDYDTYVQPSAQIGKSATVRLIVSGRTVAQTTVKTWLLP